MTSTLPVTIISGFLGAGKTTLVNRLLRNPGKERLAVLVNDFGAINIDQDLIKIESKNKIELSNGCVCCSIQDDLAAGLVSITGMKNAFTRVVVECSGVSHPAGVLKVFDTGRVAQLFHVDGLFCLIDAAMFSSLDFQSTELAIDQAAMSDLVFVNKTDLVQKEELNEIRNTLQEAQRSMKLLNVVHADVAASVLFGPRAVPRTRSDRSFPAKHEDAFEAASFEWQNPLPLQNFERFIAALPPYVLRGKGLLSVITDRDAPPQRGTFQLVGKRSSIEIETVSAPGSSQLVLIAKRGDLDRSTLRSALELCPGAHTLLPALKPTKTRHPTVCD